MTKIDKNDTIMDLIRHDLPLSKTLESPTKEETTEGSHKVAEILAPIIKEMYYTYEFRKFTPQEGDKESAHSLTFKITGRNEDRFIALAKLFKIFSDYRLSPIEASKVFREEYVDQGKVMELGEGVVVTKLYFTNPMESPDLTLIIDYIDQETYDELMRIRKEVEESLK